MVGAVTAAAGFQARPSVRSARFQGLSAVFPACVARGFGGRVRRAGRASRVSVTAGRCRRRRTLPRARSARPLRRASLPAWRRTTRQPEFTSGGVPGPKIQMAGTTGSKDEEDPARNLDTVHSIPPDPTTCRDQATSSQSSAGTYCERCFGLVVAIITPARSRVAACAARITSPSRAGSGAVGRPC